MLRRIDLWIGRHMNAKRWVAVWISFVAIFVVLLLLVDAWWTWMFCPIGVVLSTLLAWGNVRRLRRAIAGGVREFKKMSDPELRAAVMEMAQALERLAQAGMAVVEACKDFGKEKHDEPE